MNLEDLRKPFPTEKISWRVGAMTKDKTKCIALAYIDARDVMERLDEVCGVGGWQSTHPHAHGKTSCKIGIKVGDDWVWKENGAGDTQVEADKGAFSDAFKRAGVMWGIGRYLYDMPNVWVELDQYKKIKPAEITKLNKAHDQLAKGQVPVIQESKKDFTAEETKTMRDRIKSCSSPEDFESIKQELADEKHRMTEQQIKHLGAEYTEHLKKTKNPDGEAA